MARNAYYDHLRQVPLFAGFDRHDFGHLDRISTELKFPAGAVLMREGETAHEFIVVLEGALEVTRGGEHVAEIGPGGFAGEMGLLLRTQRNSTVSAATDVTVLHIEGSGFAALLEDVPQLAVKMLPIVAGRVAAAVDDHTH